MLTRLRAWGIAALLALPASPASAQPVSAPYDVSYVDRGPRIFGRQIEQITATIPRDYENCGAIPAKRSVTINMVRLPDASKVVVSSRSPSGEFKKVEPANVCIRIGISPIIEIYTAAKVTTTGGQTVYFAAPLGENIVGQPSMSNPHYQKLKTGTPARNMALLMKPTDQLTP